ncbi:neuroguidin isoform X2 [Poecile atricapillus]|uniref:neuroguidin isoform X2 n=1 Tax=Poecile atricapillus TaxID=48891 RepID=UPI002739A2AB|nr:neuroguidin isoform X2 [Poecile atricapillus]
MAAAEAVALLEALRAQVAEVAAHGREMLRRVRGGQLDTKEVLEKLRPLEQRLKYHLEKLLRAAASGGRGAEDPLSFRPAPSNMAAQEEEEEQGQGGGAKAPGLGGGRRYVPPRLVPVSCDPAPDPESRSRSRLRLRALNSAALRELRQELGEGPLEEGEGLQPPHREEIQRRRWEESMLQRLSAPCRRRRGAGLGLDDVTNFGAFPALLGANQESSEPPQKKRKKPKMGKKKGRKGFRRRR